MGGGDGCQRDIMGNAYGNYLQVGQGGGYLDDIMPQGVVQGEAIAT